MILELQQHVLDTWEALAPGRPRPARLHVLKFSAADYPPPESSLLLLVFPDRDERPVAVFKVARIAASDAPVRHEAAQLEALRPLLPPEHARVMPRCVRRGVVNGREFHLCTALPGSVAIDHAWTLARLGRDADLVQRALDWALDLAFATPQPAVRLGEWLGVATPGDLLRDLAGRGWHEAQLEALAARLGSLWESAWPAGLSHGDFWAGNLLFEARSLSGVVDWHFASIRAPVFFDVLTFETAFSINAVYGGRALDPERRRQVPGFAPLAAAHRRLQEHGVDTGPTSPAQLATLLWGVRSHRGLGAGRARIAAAYDRLLRHDLEAAGRAAPA